MLSPLYGQLSPLRIPTQIRRAAVSDSDAEAYLQAVETADGLQLEQDVANAMNSFVVGCKSDGIWSAIKASCILAGARTLSGALVPLVGTAPTNFNFVSADYNRKTGLIGNGTSKYLNTNRANNLDAQTSKHIALYVSEQDSLTSSRYYLSNGAGSSQCNLYKNGTQRFARVNSGSATASTGSLPVSSTFWGASRGSSTNFIERISGVSNTITNTATTSSVGVHALFSRDATGAVVASNSRLSFYTLGSNLNLALLDTRVTNLMTALAAAIP
jgi:hypothetical protein